MTPARTPASGRSPPAGVRARVRARARSLAQKLSCWQLERPWLVIGVIVLTLVPSLLLASRLALRTSFRELLPDGKPSVTELDRVTQRLGGMGTLILVVEGGDRTVHRRFIQAMSPRIRALGPQLVTGVDDGMWRLRAFVQDHWWVYLDLDKLGQLRDELREVKDRQVSKRAGWDLGLDEDGADEEQLSLDSLRARLSPSTDERVPDYYIGEDGAFGAIVMRTPFGTADDRVQALQEELRTIASGVALELKAPQLRVRFTGSLITSVEEHHAVVGDLTHVGAAGVALVLGIVFVYFLRFRTLIAMAATIAVGCIWTFAAAWLTVGYLNSATGFLVSIIAGNGINFGILYMARYLEGRHEEGLSLEGSIARARHDTWSGTLTAACCAAVAYGSLAVTQYPGFRQFGVIGGIGMLCCWVATFLLLPSILVVSERLSPIHARGGDWRRKTQWLFAGPLFSVTTRAPRAVALVGALVILAGTLAGARYLAHDPMEYDLRNVRNDDSDPDSARVLARRVATVIGAFSRDGLAVLVDRLDQIDPLVRALRERRDAAPQGQEPFGRVVSIRDLVPAHQAEKIAIAREIVDLAQYARRRGFVDDETWSQVAPRIPETLQPVQTADLPEDLAWIFEEADGRRGRIVYLVPTPGRSLNDAHYLMLWADSFRTVELPNGEVVHGSGAPVVFADVLLSTREEAPKAVLVSLVGTVLVMLGAFRLRRAGWLGLASVMAGSAALLGFFAAAGVRINFLNFMALPITIGVGADYAVNVMRRHEQSCDRSGRAAFVRTGGAVVLCSLTTMLGYGALLSSLNGAVRSFGLAAAAGELVMILSAVVLLPAWVLVGGRHRRGQPAHRAPVELGHGGRLPEADVPCQSNAGRDCPTVYERRPATAGGGPPPAR